MPALFFCHDAGPVVVNFEQANYLVDESSGLCTVTIVTSYPPTFHFEARITVSFNRQQGAKYGNFMTICMIYKIISFYC